MPKDQIVCQVYVYICARGHPCHLHFEGVLNQHENHEKHENDTSVDPKQQYISRLSKTCVYKAGHGVSSCSLWSMPSEHGASSWGIIMGHLYRFMGHHHLEHEHAQANAACNNATSNCSSERPSHVVFHAAHYFGLFIGAT